MDTRREFIKKSALLSGMTGMNALLPASIKRAMAIDPKPGSSWQDAEHIVILMQENRSFDHCFGELRGVRGFNDPRAIRLPDGNPVWLQSDASGHTFPPFRLNIKDTKATWMSSLPHTWKDQVGARNDGRYDQWLKEKRNGKKEYADMPLTMGYYNRQDIPFYYELADAFTVCDQHFCSSLTGTTPNRLFLWSGTIRAEQNEHSRAHVWNEDADYESLHWKTFPEIMEDYGISWKFYQNELSVDVGFTEEESAWLSNFGDNPLEFFSRYHVRMHKKYTLWLQKRILALPVEIETLKRTLGNMPVTGPERENVRKTLDEKEKELAKSLEAYKKYNDEHFDKLTATEKNIHRKAFDTNVNDPDYHTLTNITYNDGGIQRDLTLPKGDLLHQFRKDVQTGHLPTVSWLAAPENLSDHPSSAWYGAWYVSEVMDILTQNPEVWKKTIFILTYDENDGYFDHVPPFVAPHSGRPETGAVSGGMDTRVEYVTLEQEKERNGFPVECEKESSIGLGYRVPLIVASPWSRGGYVNSQVFDHTSTLQFLEKFLSLKTGKSIHNPLISEWRRSISGDLTSIFRPSVREQKTSLDFLDKDSFLESVYNAKFKKLPTGFKSLSPAEIDIFRKDPYASPLMPKQEKGIRPSNALFYELYAEGFLDPERKKFHIRFESGSKAFGNNALGAPFNVYAPGKYLQYENGSAVFKAVRTWAFAVQPAGFLDVSWPLSEFENNIYHLRVYGPNGYFREFKGSVDDPLTDIRTNYKFSTRNQPTGNMEVTVHNADNKPIRIQITDNAYQNPVIIKTIQPAKGMAKEIFPLNLSRQFGWYDFSVRTIGNELCERRYAGRVETGRDGFSDPYMGRVV